MPYARSWKPSHFNRVNNETLAMLRKKLSIELKKKAAEVYEISNGILGYVVQEDNTDQL